MNQIHRYEDFSFINTNGDEILFTCEGSKLRNLYGKNKESPYYLTPISFNKEVLKKYYDKPSQYSVRDGYVSCEGMWSMPIDVKDCRVVVFLGDLSKLPYLEQKYWRSFNVSEKTKISRVNWERSFQCNWDIETDRPDFFFKKRYQDFNNKWHEKHHWFFFKPLLNEDQHCFESLRELLSEEESEFDTQILYLVKIFIESINIQKITDTFPASYIKNNKTIGVLDQFLKSVHIRANSMIEFLKKLQKLRSKASAHRKNRDEYKEIVDYFKRNTKVQNLESKKELFSNILIRCIWTIDFLETYTLKVNEK